MTLLVPFSSSCGWPQIKWHGLSQITQEWLSEYTSWQATHFITGTAIISSSFDVVAGLFSAMFGGLTADFSAKRDRIINA